MWHELEAQGPPWKFAVDVHRQIRPDAHHLRRTAPIQPKPPRQHRFYSAMFDGNMLETEERARTKKILIGVK